MNFLHIMLRVRQLDENITFFGLLGFQETRRFDQPAGRFTLVYLQNSSTQVELELTHNWDQDEAYSNGNNFGHIAMGVNHIYDTCEALMETGAVVARPPRDGAMAFIISPDGISIELLQMNRALEIKQPWQSMSNKGSW